MNISNSPKVSVVIPTYNRAALLPRAVNSVLSQDFKDYEIIIVDDCSTDATQEVIRRFTDPRIRSVRHERNQRQSAAINTGIAHARGEYIAFLDDDDELSPGSLAGRVELLDASPPDVAICYGTVSVFDDSTGLTTSIDRRQFFLPDTGIVTRCLALESPCSTLSMLVRGSVARELGGYDIRYSELNDMNFSCRVALRYQIVEIPRVVAVQHISHGHSQMTETHTNDLVDSVYRHMADFESELSCPLLSQHGDAYAAVLIRLAIRYVMVRRRVSAIRTYWKAVTTAGICSRLAVRATVHFLKVFLWYATLLSGIRGGARKFRNCLKAALRGRERNR